jgi:hypothetical protein
MKTHFGRIKIIVTNEITAETMPAISPTANLDDDPTVFVRVDAEDGPFRSVVVPVAEAIGNILLEEATAASDYGQRYSLFQEAWKHSSVTLTRRFVIHVNSG